MRLLLDTHIWIWALSAPDRLPDAIATALADKHAELWLSPISVWEFLTLARKNRIMIASDPYEWLDEARRQAPMREAPLTNAIIIESQRLALPHWDPADRFIAATARHLGLTLATVDQKLVAAKELATFPIG